MTWQLTCCRFPHWHQINSFSVPHHLLGWACHLAVGWNVTWLLWLIIQEGLWDMQQKKCDEFQSCQVTLRYFQEPHWFPMGLPEISRVTWQLIPTGILSSNALLLDNNDGNTGDNNFKNNSSTKPFQSLKPLSIVSWGVIDDKWKWCK